MPTVSDTIKEFKFYDKFFTACFTIGVVSCLFFTSGKIYSQYWFIYACVVIALVCFTLDLNFALKIEGKTTDERTLRLNSDLLEINPYKEISRYVDSVSYYNNIWRASMVIAAVLTLIMYPIIDKQYRHMTPYFFLAIFTIIVHYWDWKQHHSLRFMHKTVMDVCNHLAVNKSSTFTQATHL